MAHVRFVGQGEELAVDLVAADGCKREWGDELGPAVGKDTAHLDAAFAKAANHLKALVSRDSAGDDQ